VPQRLLGENVSNTTSTQYPLLAGILEVQKLPLQPMYTNRDVAKIFQVCVRAIQNWINAGKLTPRDLPGRWKYFPQDLEDFLTASKRAEQNG
jgi:hypothetical protein